MGQTKSKTISTNVTGDNIDNELYLKNKYTGLYMLLRSRPNTKLPNLELLYTSALTPVNAAQGIGPCGALEGCILQT